MVSSKTYVTKVYRIRSFLSVTLRISRAGEKGVRGADINTGSPRREWPRRVTRGACDGESDLSPLYGWWAAGLPAAARPRRLTSKRAISGKSASVTPASRTQDNELKKKSSSSRARAADWGSSRPASLCAGHKRVVNARRVERLMRSSRFLPTQPVADHRSRSLASSTM